MNWRDKLIEQKWLHPFLPNYMKPLEDSAVINEQTREFVYEAEEFISDLAALSELPRVNKTFKRSIQGFTYKIKIKPRKIHVEMIDSQKSSSTLKKRVFITVYRHHVKKEGGNGKITDSTIYYQKDSHTYVRSIRRHPSFQSVFYHIHRLDLSVSGESVPAANMISESSSDKSAAITSDQEALSLKDSLSDISYRFQGLDDKISILLHSMKEPLHMTVEDFELLNIEEKHQLKRMLLHDIPNLLQTYESLTPSQRQTSYERVISSLNNMYDFIKKQAEDLQATRQERMNHLLQLNELRYDPSLQHENTKTSTIMKRHQRDMEDR
ncbi:hypothetical protein [Alkalicoccus halolimnae]|uniref:Uncharacterized protein n=1 Tax=Alkalicoccus halolimnae TaxID=1667239 RepID=A0A5C7FCF7_9BACI|nr:hypothetical protein [Alkalicoccus halolimnae]TXF87158.1 hypothetical protein FTX54_00085 [Alkalicoccus halolimnae]